MDLTVTRYPDIYCHIMYLLICIQVLNKPSSEQQCSKAHEPYALHEKIRSRECPLSEEIEALEKRFKTSVK